MNINHLLNDIKRSLGIGTFIKTRYSDYELMAYIQSHTRPTISRIYSTEVLMTYMVFNSKNVVDASSFIYKFPEELTHELDKQKSFINGIKSIELSMYDKNNNVRDLYTGHPTMVGSSYLPAANSIYGGLGGAVGNACMRDSLEMIRRKIRASFIAPNKIRFGVDGMAPEGCAFDIRLRVGHPLSMYTIPQSLYDVVLTIATYDIQEFLWNNELKDLEGLSNGYDNIALKIDDWADAGKLRKEYINEYLYDDIAIQEGMKVY